MQKIGWKRPTGEVLLIVVGILVALAIDSFVATRAEKRQGQEYLAELVAELRSDSVRLTRYAGDVSGLIESAISVLQSIEGSAPLPSDLGDRFLRSMRGEGITQESVVWVELSTTGRLRLINSPAVRRAVVAHYLDRARRFSTVDEHFVPAVGALRAVGWDVMSVPEFSSFFTTGQSGVEPEALIQKIGRRDDVVFLLKSVIVTASAARANVGAIAGSSGELIETIEGLTARPAS